MEKANLTDRPSKDQRTEDRRKAQDQHYAGDERRKAERRRSKP
jgi:hypothetical protein